MQRRVCASGARAGQRSCYRRTGRARMEHRELEVGCGVGDGEGGEVSPRAGQCMRGSLRGVWEVGCVLRRKGGAASTARRAHLHDFRGVCAGWSGYKRARDRGSRAAAYGEVGVIGTVVSASAFCIGVSFQIRVGCYVLNQRGGYSSGMYLVRIDGQVSGTWVTRGEAKTV
ncbi:hypothetical protein B0H13DRAFT_826876 [Mycena leptocephala]|nr:hypothetical protein B0H13DRAFT_826876 [Mycena leptocephala]